ncbi:MAG TPA: hypothetical protein VLG44_06310 [Chlamydiales bacterium]|nr:hypothetical protein [Chlamydiales bacterium]
MRQVAIYLAGSIKKGHENPHETFWTEENRKEITKGLTSFKVSFLNPALRKDNLSDQRSVFGRDMLQVFCSDVVFADVRDRRGLGVGAEMMWAKVHHIPVIAWAPKESHYHKSKATILDVPVENFIHPFVESLSDVVVETLEEGAHWMHAYFSGKTKIKIKGIEFIRSAMEYYKSTQLEFDLPMKEVLSEEKLIKKVAMIRNL